MAVAILAMFGIVAAIVVIRLGHKPQSQTNLTGCALAAPTAQPSLFSDDRNTAILLSQQGSAQRILRTEPANVLPGMFDALLSISRDGHKLAYVTARDEIMNDAHIYAFDVDHPDQRVELAAVPKGLWPLRPVWAPDASKLAYVTADDAAPYTFRVWAADAGGGRTVEQVQYQREDFLPPATPSLCWTSTSAVKVVGFQGATPANPQSSTTTTSGSAGGSSGGGTTTASGSVSGGAQCDLPVMSQNDPRWRHLFMQYAGDSIGGYGCALTSTAMVLNYFGVSTDVSQLNACMGSNADPLYWGVAPHCSSGLVSGGDLAPFSWSHLDAVLARGDPEIIGVVRGLTGSHFVVVTSGGGDVADGYHITDPWDGTTTKTLGYYTARGYNLDWMVTYAGTGHGCGRLVDGPGVNIGGVMDGGVYTGDVTVDPGQNSNYSGPPQITMITGSDGVMGGLSPTPSPSASATSSGSTSSSSGGSFTFILPPLSVITFNPIPTGGLHLTQEGVYEILVNLTGPGGPHTVTEKFTIDHTPPTLGVNFLDQLAQKTAFVTTANGTPAPAAPPTPASTPIVGIPLLARPGQVQIAHSDALSGVQEVDYSLDGGQWQPYTDLVNASRVISVDQLGQHTISVQGVDLAGNKSAITTESFIVVAFGPATPTPSATPSPSPSPSPSATPSATPTATATPKATPTSTPTARPTPTPTPCPMSVPVVTTSQPSSNGNGGVIVGIIDWRGSSPCNVTSTVVRVLTGSTVAPLRTNVTTTQPGASGTAKDSFSCSYYQSGYDQVSYEIVLTDPHNNTYTSQPSQPGNLAPICG